MTVLEVIQRGADFLTRKGVDSPRLQAELLLAHVLNLPRLNLYLQFQRPLTERELEVVREMLKRRGAREPLQHIVGSTSFCGLEFKVTSAVLVPRPETELLAEFGWKWINALPRQSTERVVLDYGAGSGCLAVTIAINAPHARIYALEASEPALAVARENTSRHRVADRVHLIHGTGFEALPAELRFDLIVTNPPYIATSEIDSLMPEVRDHDPRQALDGGADGLDFYRFLAREAARRMQPGGRLMAEFGDGQEPHVREIFGANEWVVESVEPDLSGRSRFVIARPSGMRKE